MTQQTADLSLSAFKAQQLLAELGDHTVKTADELGAKVGVCVRTVYRYVRDLRAAGHPIMSEAGIGYMLRRRAVKGDQP